MLNTCPTNAGPPAAFPLVPSRATRTGLAAGREDSAVAEARAAVEAEKGGEKKRGREREEMEEVGGL